MIHLLPPSRVIMESLKTATESCNSELHMCPGRNVCSSMLRLASNPSACGNQNVACNNPGVLDVVESRPCIVGSNCTAATCCRSFCIGKGIVKIHIHWSHTVFEPNNVLHRLERMGFTNDQPIRSNLYIRELGFTVPPIQYRIGVDTLG
jgi:hypothetical protein